MERTRRGQAECAEERGRIQAERERRGGATGKLAPKSTDQNQTVTGMCLISGFFFSTPASRYHEIATCLRGWD